VSDRLVLVTGLKRGVDANFFTYIQRDAEAFEYLETLDSARTV